MAYRIKELSDNPKRKWKVQFCTYEKAGRRDKDIPETEWMRLGFHRDMSVEEAKAIRDKLNAQLHLKQVEEKRIHIAARQKEATSVLAAFLGARDVAEFEQDVLRIAEKRNKKILSHWKKAQECLVQVRIEPEDWEDRRSHFYSYFAREKMSPSYVQKVNHILNLWGKFVTKKRRQFFAPLPMPSRFDKEKIADSYFDKKVRGKESAPLTPKLLKKFASSFEEKHLAWLTLSLWFGLRPIEVDSLHETGNFRVEKHKGIPVLFVYQSKLRSIAREKRWKYVPCIQEEQKDALKLLHADFRRPVTKAIQARFGEDFTLYAGRKGFEPLMHELGYRLEDISLWLGHRSIERTWRNYKERSRVIIPVID